MPARESAIGAVFETLGFALFLREEPGVLKLAGEAPAWLKGIWPGAVQTGSVLEVSELSPFLENFLIDAGECWTAGGTSRVKSGPWIEGTDLELEATALSVNGQAVLLIEQLGKDFETRKAVLQKARETVIAYQRLNTEMQKKEILLHCIAEDMTGALGNVITSLRLIELEHDPLKTRRLLELAMLATQEQQNLIHRVLDVFAEELESLYGRAGKSQAEAEVHDVMQRALGAVQSEYQEKRVRLTASGFGTLRVAVDAGHLERVFVNLLENALHATPAGGEVKVRIEAEANTVLLQFDDGGAEIHEEVSEKLFAKFDCSEARPQATALRLHFCRIAIENCNGEIGHTSLGTAGNRFWIRLPGFHPAQ
ncbi:MAG: histidine kinase [Chthoniobacteraceae bacterium]|nr:histidine kinase [Chthoniobacteraceae bacterium]